jgi:organic hydroperoxide reductase OsmC/OhrA
MSEYKAIIEWRLDGGDFLRGKYSRAHTWTFDGGVVVPASSAPSSVPIPYSNPANVDPEEAFVAAISSCHMLTYLFLAYKDGFQVETYRDEAVGILTKNERGVPWVSQVILRPKITYGGGTLPGAAEVEHLHHLAHEQCYIAASVRTEIKVEAEK